MKRVLLGVLIAVGLTCAPSVQAQPDVDFGQVEVGRDSTIAVHFQFPDSGSLSLRTSGPFYCIPCYWHFGHEFEVHVLFVPREAEVFDDSLHYSFNEREGGISLHGEGVIPAATGNSFILPPSAFILSAFPNPFNPTTEIDFSVPIAGRVTIKVFNLLGQQVSVLQNGFLTSGEHHVLFDGKQLPAGIYFLRIEAASHQRTLKLVLLK